MNCKNCGKEIETGAAFCTFCGTKVEQAAEEPVIEEKAASTQFGSAFEQAEQPAAPYANGQQNEKVDFGKGALAFCLVVIGILSISTGVFAGLYFSVI